MEQIETLNIRQVQEQCYRTAFEHGFHPHDEPVDIDKKLLLTVTELCEAQNEIRSGHTPQHIYFADTKPEGFGIELADAVIRIFDLAEVLNLDIQSLMSMKMAYNETRPHKHGRAF